MMCVLPVRRHVKNPGSVRLNSRGVLRGECGLCDDVNGGRKMQVNTNNCVLYYSGSSSL